MQSTAQDMHKACTRYARVGWPYWLAYSFNIHTRMYLSCGHVRRCDSQHDYGGHLPCLDILGRHKGCTGLLGAFLGHDKAMQEIVAARAARCWRANRAIRQPGNRQHARLYRPHKARSGWARPSHNAGDNRRHRAAQGRDKAFSGVVDNSVDKLWISGSICPFLPFRVIPLSVLFIYSCLPSFYILLHPFHPFHPFLSYSILRLPM